MNPLATWILLKRNVRPEKRHCVMVVPEAEAVAGWRNQIGAMVLCVRFR